MAVAPSRPPLSFARDAQELTLEQLLEEAREAYALELAIPMTVDAPPALYDRGADGQLVADSEAAYGAQVGLSMSAQLVRRLGHPEGYGNAFPLARALDDLRGWCRGRHLEGRNGAWLDHAADVPLLPELQRPLCARLAHYTVAWGMSPLWAAHQEQLPLPVVIRLLLVALRHMWDQRRHWAYSEDPEAGGGAEVIIQLRQEDRRRRRRADEARASAGAVCKYCSRPYDPDSLEPCPGDPNDQLDPIDAAIYAQAGFVLLCSPADPS